MSPTLHPLVILASLTLCSAVRAEPAAPKPPAKTAKLAIKGWYVYDEPTGTYESDVDRTVSRSGKASGRLRSVPAQTNGFGALGQRFSGELYRGKRVRFSAFVRTDTVGNAAGISLRIDTQGADGKTPPPLIYSTIDQQPLRAQTEWTPLALVVDVPADAVQVAIALLLRGGGAAWIDDVKLDVVDKSVPLTAMPTQPRNLGFEE